MFKWSIPMDPDKWPDEPLGEPVLVCETPEEASRIARACNQGKVVILEMWRRISNEGAR